MGISSTSRIAGSETDESLAIWIQKKWIDYGITDTSIETYYPILNTPNKTRLAIVTGEPYEANLDQDIFHAHSGNGNVTGSVVYVNYGRLTDFQFLATRGIQFNGTIALIRHGLIHNGIKVKIAQEFGCIGVLLYQDPEEQPESNAR
jgi:N-acetylated-alpha-linked acidic dipeptidase